ncbi:MAG: hypothetical protein KGI54_09440 [Pseudomonadota bacterium]|nr:hypothetical protein [Pseudomonadota bacterium]
MAEYSKLARGSYLSLLNTPYTVQLPFTPGLVKLYNYTVAGAPAAGSVLQAYWTSSLPNGSASVTLYDSSVALTTGNIASGGITVFVNGLGNQFGPQQQVIGITKANPPIVNVSNHGYAVGDTVIFEGLYQSATTGMPQICGIQFLVETVADADHFTVTWDTTGSNYTALSGSPSGAFVRKVIAPFNYVPGATVMENITDNANNTASITTAGAHNLSVGSQFNFRVPFQWGATQLNSNPLIPGGSPIYATVTSIQSANSFTCSLLSGFYSNLNLNVPVSAVPGLSFPQIIATGDLNTGGGAVTVNSIPSVNGPAINGSFINNTSRGFVVGLGVVNAAAELILWEATAYDYVSIQTT